MGEVLKELVDALVPVAAESGRGFQFWVEVLFKKGTLLCFSAYSIAITLLHFEFGLKVGISERVGLVHHALVTQVNIVFLLNAYL